MAPVDEKRAREISGLVGHPSWEPLAAEINEALDRYWNAVGKRIRRGDIIDQREIDFMRGRADAAELFLRQPDRALKDLVKRAKDEEERKLDE